MPRSVPSNGRRSGLRHLHLLTTRAPWSEGALTRSRWEGRSPYLCRYGCKNSRCYEQPSQQHASTRFEVRRLAVVSTRALPRPTLWCISAIQNDVSPCPGTGRHSESTICLFLRCRCSRRALENPQKLDVFQVTSPKKYTFRQSCHACLSRIRSISQFTGILGVVWP